MVPLFIGLTLVNLIGLGTAAALGYAAKAGYAVAPWHMLAGALAALVYCAVHCVVFTYFAATAKWVQHAINVKRLDPQLAAPTRSFKAQALPAALLAMGSTFVAAMLARRGQFSRRMAALAPRFGGELLRNQHDGGAVELRAIRRNGSLIDGVLGRWRRRARKSCEPQTQSSRQAGAIARTGRPG